MGIRVRRRTLLIAGLVWVGVALLGGMTGPNRGSGALVGVLFIAIVIYAGMVLIGWTINNPDEIGHRVAVATLITGLAFVVYALIGLLVDGANYRFFGFAGVIGGAFMSVSVLVRSRLIRMAHDNQRTPAQQQQDIVDIYKHIRKP